MQTTLTQNNLTDFSCLSGLISHFPLYINPFAVTPCGRGAGDPFSFSSCHPGNRSGIFSSIHAASTTLPCASYGFGPDFINPFHRS